MREFSRTYIKPYWVLWVLILIAGISLLINICYFDFYITVRHSLTLCDALFSGQIGSFYQLCAPNLPGGTGGNSLISTSTGAYYDITLYIILAIWNLPLYIFEKMSGLNCQDFMACVWYSKCILLVFLAISSYYILHIAEQLGANQDRRCKMLLAYFSSCLILAYTFGSANYDIIEITFALIGIDAFLEKKYRRFILMFALANSIKYFTFCLFVPLIILKNNKVSSFLKDFLMGTVFIAVSKAAFVTYSPYSASSINQKRDFINVLISSGHWISEYIILFGVVCVLALCWGRDESKLSKKRIVYLCFLSMVGFISFGTAFAFWAMMAVPFMLLVVFTCERHSKLLLLLFTIYQLVILISKQMQYPYVYDCTTFVNLPLYWIFGSKIPVGLQTYEQGFSIGSIFQWFLNSGINLKQVAITFYILCFGLISIIAMPRQKQISLIENDRLGEMTDKDVKYSSLIMIIYSFLPLVLYVIQAIRKV